MDNRAVVAFQKIVNHRLPVGLDAVGEPMPKGQFVQIRSVAHDLVLQTLCFAGQRQSFRIKIDKDQMAEHLKANGREGKILRMKVLH